MDARYGLIPYAPAYVLALTGPFLFRGRPSRLGWALPAAAVYYVTVASADNWSGAVCSLGRYAMPLIPLAAAVLAVVLDRTGSRRGALALALTLAAWTGLIAPCLARSPGLERRRGPPEKTLRRWERHIPNLFIKT